MTAGKLALTHPSFGGRVQRIEISKYLIFSVVFLILLSILYSLFSIPPAFAQTSASSSQLQPTTYNLQPDYIPSQSPHLASMAFYNFGHALNCILVGQSVIAPCLEYKFIKDTQGSIKSVPVLSSVNTSGGLLGMGSSMIDMLYTEKPLDQMSFFTYLGRNLGIVKEANAQVPGSGNQVLSPIFALWSVSRNFAYLVMIAIFILVGLMVMFRQKLNPQTVVSVQMALPGLVIGLILITFSYFLSALITDMAYVGTNLVGYYFDQAIQVNGGPAASGPLTEALSTQNALSVGADTAAILDESTLKTLIDNFYNYLPPNPKGNPLLSPQRVVSLFSAAITYMFYNTMLSPVFDLGFGAASGLSGVAGAGLAKLAAGAAGYAAKAASFAKGLGIASSLGGGGATAMAAWWAKEAYNDPGYWLAYWASILAIIILLYTIVKLFFRLINNYLMIIFLTIASPFVFLASSIPGRQDMAVSWMRNMLCNVLAFPAVIGVFYFAAFLVGSDPQIRAFGVTTPLNLTNATGNLPFLGGLDLSFLRKILAFMAILATPTIPDVICRTVGKQSQGGAGALLGGAIGGAIGAGRQYEGQLTGQLQKAGADTGTWKESLFGRSPYTGGRFGILQAKMHALNDPTFSKSVGDTDRLKQMHWINPQRWIEAWRRGLYSNAPQSAGARESEGVGTRTRME